ncbi:queuosine salvage family protein [Candidatus Woesearchaeota archaeon]|nr:queuosine salvage family protein [Candidatus Woesearchaeota archaeon]
MDILAGAKFVVENAQHISINKNALVSFSKNFHHGDVNHWLSAAPVDFSALSEEEILNFLLVYSTIGFCYWGNQPWSVKYRGKKHLGSFAMLAAIMKAHEKGIQILDPKYRSRINAQEFSEILEIKENNQIYLFQERLAFLHESGAVILEKYDGKISTLLKLGDGDVIKLLDILTRDFLAYNDFYTYCGKKISFNKKAQLFISDVFQIFGGEGIGHFHNIQKLTALADYRIPQVLRNLGILVYSPELADKIDRGILISKGSPEEIELRAGMIWAVHLIYNLIKEREQRVLPIGVNDHLWLLRRQKFSDDHIHHKTITTGY